MLPKKVINKLPLIAEVITPSAYEDKFENSDKDSREVTFANPKSSAAAFKAVNCDLDVSLPILDTDF